MHYRKAGEWRSERMGRQHTYTRAHIHALHARKHTHLDDDLSSPAKGDEAITGVGRSEATADCSTSDATGLVVAALAAALVSMATATVICPASLWCDKYRGRGNTISLFSVCTTCRKPVILFGSSNLNTPPFRVSLA